MTKIEKITNVHDYNAYIGAADEHPLVSVINYNELPPIRHSLNNYNVYGLFLREDKLVDLVYGCGRYDYDETTLICVKPGQIGGKKDDGTTVKLKGWALLFHPDLFHGTPFERKLQQYSFFSYNINEALHMSQEERNILVSYFKMIKITFHETKGLYQNSIIINLIDNGTAILHEIL